MSEPTSALKFEDLILRVAVEAGVAYHGADGQGRAMIPLDVNDLDRCKRIVNNGIRSFISDAPLKGWRWMRRAMTVSITGTRVAGTADSAGATTLVDATLSSTYDSDDDLQGWYIYITDGTGEGSYAIITSYTALTGTCTVADWLDTHGNPGGTDPVAGDSFAITPVETVDGDIYRYPLPDNFGGEVDGPINYAANTGHSSVIEWVDESVITAHRAVVTNTGYPDMAAIRVLEPKSGSGGPTRRFELVLDPEPVATDTLQFPYTVFFDELRLEASLNTGSSDTTLVDSGLANLYPDDYFNGWTAKILAGNGEGSYAVVTDYTGSTGTFTVADWLFRNGTAGGPNPATAAEIAADSSVASFYQITPPGNLHPAGMRFDQAILASCLATAEMEINEGMSPGWIDKYKNFDHPHAVSMDIRSAPRRLGSMNANQRGSFRERTWNDVTYNGS